MRHIENKIPELQSHFFESFNLTDCVHETIDGINHNLETKYLSEDVQNLLKYVLDKLKQINQFVNKDVRFDYLLLQSAIEELYRKDNSITGCRITFNFNEDVKNENYAYLIFNAVKS